MKTIFYFITTLILLGGCADIKEEHGEDSAKTTRKRNNQKVGLQLRWKITCSSE